MGVFVRLFDIVALLTYIQPPWFGIRYSLGSYRICEDNTFLVPPQKKKTKKHARIFRSLFFTACRRPKAAMHKENANNRRQLGADQKLQESFSRKCSLKKDSKQFAASAQPQFVASRCLSLGICVCTKHPDAYHMWKNVSEIFKHLFTKRKGIKTEQRALAARRS